MADPRIVTAYAELPGSSNHHDFLLPWMFDEAKQSASEQTSLPHSPPKSPILTSRFREIGVDVKTGIPSTIEHSLLAKKRTQGHSEAIKDFAEDPKRDLLGQMRKSGFTKPLQYVTGLMRAGSLSPRENTGHSESSIHNGTSASGGVSASTSSAPKGSLRPVKKVDAIVPLGQPSTFTATSLSTKVNRPKPQSSRSEGYNENGLLPKESRRQRPKPQSSPTESAQGRKIESSSNLKDSERSTMPCVLGSATGDENLLATLKRYHTVFLVDDSASMAKDGHWEGAQAVLKALVQSAIQYDTDGVDLYFLNSPENLKNTKSIVQILDKLHSIQPEGDTTPTETRLEEILNAYLERIEKGKQDNELIPKPLSLVIVTDGIADDVDSLISIIRQVSTRLDVGRFPLNQIGIQFVQIGNDKQVTRFLRVLDNHLQSRYGISRDIIDTTRFLGETPEPFITKCLLGGINRRVDRMYNSRGLSSREL